MANVIQVRGVPELLKKLRSRNKAFGKKVERGLKQAGLFIQRESQLIVPVDKGNLKASADTRQSGSGLKTEIRVVYTADYAVYVHENKNALHGQAYNDAYIITTRKVMKSGKVKLSHKWTKRAERMGYHLDPDLKPHTRGVNQQAKFLEDPVRKNIRRIGQIVRTSAGVS